jgi:hypothetical protein
MGLREPIREGAFSAISIKGRPKFQGKCYNYRKTGHRARDYKAPKRDTKGKNPSTGPLSTPLGERGLSLGPIGSIDSAKYTIEHS